MEPADLTLEILKDIRDEIRVTRTQLSERIDSLGSRVDGVAERVDVVAERVDQLSVRVVESEIRTATAIADLSGTVRERTRAGRARQRRRLAHRT